MDMLTGDQIAEADLTDWRKLAQGLHARYAVDDFGAAARFVAALGDVGDEFGHHPQVSIGRGYVDLRLTSSDAIYRDEVGLGQDDDVIAYCRIGERSSHTWFVLTHLLGFDNVRNYDGSWTEWGNAVRVPVAQGEERGEAPGAAR